MRKMAVFGALLVSAARLVAADWSYSVKHDTFDDITIKTALLLGDRAAVLTLDTMSNGNNLAYLSGRDFECFPSCTIRVKFDSDPPIGFQANSPRVISALVVLSDFDGFVNRLKTAKEVTVRGPFFRRVDDMHFTISAPYNPDHFLAAEAKATADRTCKANAVSEDYSACMARLLPPK